MTSSKRLIFILIVVLMTGCRGGGGGGSSAVPGPTPIVIPGNNVLSITVNGSLCSPSTSVGYLNKPCVSVTICNPSTSTCQTIDDILLDTGSFGLRIFKSVLNSTISLTQVPSVSGGLLAECAHFGDGSSIWGPVQMANVILGEEPAVQVPIQVGDSTFAAIPAACAAGVLASPVLAGFNGILGVGVFIQDCGPDCTTNPNKGIYYTCTGSICNGTTVAFTSQVQNPVALLPFDNNGVIVELPGVSGGASSVIGSLVLGIGTGTNNIVASGVTTYATDGIGEIITTINGISPYSAIIDSGSNGYFFTPPSASQLPDCGSPNQSWFCPSSTVTINATNAGTSGSPSSPVSFQIGNFTTLVNSNSNNKVFSNIGGGNGPGKFDWGLPFYLGRNVYVGIEGKGGPYFAY
jgi:Protein of unknown function (DUF3443)